MVVEEPTAVQHQEQEVVDGEEVEQHGDLYSPRTGAAAATHGGLVYLFGGTARRRRVDELYVLDTATTTWTLMEPKSELHPDPRSVAESVILGDRLYVFGGHIAPKESRPPTLFAFDTEIKGPPTLFAFDFATQQWEELPAESPPAGRVDFTMVAHDQEILVFGGTNGTKRFNDLSKYSLVESTWRTVAPDGAVPSPRFGHSGVVHAASAKLIVFGGWDGRRTVSDLLALDLKSYKWEKLETTGEGPSHRYRHTAAIYGDAMLVFGGIDMNKQRFNDLYRLDLLTNTWTQVRINMLHDQLLPARTFHEMVVVNDKLLVMGGYDEATRFNTLHAFDLKPKQEESEDESLAMRMRIVVRLAGPVRVYHGASLRVTRE